MTESAELMKVQKHLSLLREEYVKLQNKYLELEKKHNILISNSNIDENENNYIIRLLKTISNLFNNELYSDCFIKLDNNTIIKGHKFILSSRTDYFQSLFTQTNCLDLTNMSYEIGYNLIKWMYTNDFDLNSIKHPEEFYSNMIEQANKFDLTDLKSRCEENIIMYINVENCIKFYEKSIGLNANNLKVYCNRLIALHWDDFTAEDFSYMNASSLYEMFKTKTKYPLHVSIKTQREDVLFLYLIENNSDIVTKINEFDEKNEVPLEIALRTRQESIAFNLIRNSANINIIDDKDNGLTLLHKAILRKDDYSALFLVNNGIELNTQSKTDRKTGLMYLAETKLYNQDITDKILQKDFIDVNKQDSDGNTCLHISITKNNKQFFRQIIQSHSLNINVNIRNNNNEVPLWIALKTSDSLNEFEDESFSKQLINKGADINILNENGDTLLHLCARNGLENSAIFLINQKADVNLVNYQNETPLHLACEFDLHRFVDYLLLNGAKPNILNKLNNFTEDGNQLFNQTPMHKAITKGNENIINLFITRKDLIKCDFDLVDSSNNTILSLALFMNLMKTAQNLIQNKCSNININQDNGETLLHQAILRQNTDAALFLIENNIDINARTINGLTALQLAIKRHLPLVVEKLCVNGVDLNVVDENGDSALWNALDSGQEDIASILVNNGCDTTQWSPSGPDNCLQTLLHRAIDENNEAIAVFLIKSNTDINSPRKPGVNGETPEEASDGMTPLHLACVWGLEKIVKSLVEKIDCEINKQDVDGNTPLHLAIMNDNDLIAKILIQQHNQNGLKIKNNKAQTPFAISLIRKNIKIAQDILKFEPNAAEQFEKGRNFLHLAVFNSDIETVLMLLSLNINVNSRTQDNQSKTALHIAVEIGHEIIIRNLILANANINDVTQQKKNALHLVAETCNSSTSSTTALILLENNIDFNALDSGSNNALHVAVQYANFEVINVLLKNSDIDTYVLNSKGQSPLHLLALYGKENSTEILELFFKSIPNFDLDHKDVRGNTSLLLAYQNGNGSLCRSLIRYGAALGAYNDDGLSVFNYPVATKQLLYKLLEVLLKEPPWVECETCMECKTKFTITMRKHHCRHCGRVLCKKCSEKEISILKFNIQKPVRVCHLCFDVLTANGELFR